MSHHWKSFVNNPTNSSEISHLLLRSGVLTDEETAELTGTNRLAGRSADKARMDVLASILSPYYDQINLRYHRVSERMGVMERVINRIRDIRRQDEIDRLEAEKAAIDKRLK